MYSHEPLTFHDGNLMEILKFIHVFPRKTPSSVSSPVARSARFNYKDTSMQETEPLVVHIDRRRTVKELKELISEVCTSFYIHT